MCNTIRYNVQYGKCDVKIRNTRNMIRQLRFALLKVLILC
jgi:hypothetical protein